MRDIRNTDMTEKVSYLTTEISMPCLSMKFSFSELDSKHFWDDSRQKGSVPSPTYSMSGVRIEFLISIGIEQRNREEDDTHETG